MTNESANIDENARLELVLNNFGQLYGNDRPVVVRAPGRVNLIGEHTDYNMGFVFPVAINRDVIIAALPRDDGMVEAYSINFDQTATFSLDDIRRDDSAPWSNYVRGVVQMMQQAGLPVTGMKMVIEGNVPIGSGLSSSAAIEVATGFTAQQLAGFDLDKVQLALLCQKAENRFVGVNSGIMDQYISALGQAGKALLIDCRDLTYKPVPVTQGHDVTIVVADTMTRRGLVDSEYNARRAECEEGVRILSQFLPDAHALRDVTPAQLEQYKDRLPPVVYKRCKHVVDEDERVLESVNALEKGDLIRFGQLMIQSHISLRDLYQVSSPALDTMVEDALKLDGCLGSRLTGAGFGGCTVSLVRREAVDAFVENLGQQYSEQTGRDPQIYVCKVVGGVSRLQ